MPQIANPKAISKKAKKHTVTPLLGRDTFLIKSGGSGSEYFVRLIPDSEGGTCDCEWGKWRRYKDAYRSGCSHVQKVYQHLEELRNRSTSAWSSLEDAQRQHRPITDIGDGVHLTSRRI